MLAYPSYVHPRPLFRYPIPPHEYIPLAHSLTFELSGNMSLRAIIKQRRQWALRATRRNEGPNVNNQRLLNIKDGVIPALLHLALQDGAVDWEIARNGTNRWTCIAPALHPLVSH